MTATPATAPDRAPLKLRREDYQYETVAFNKGGRPSKTGSPTDPVISLEKVGIDKHLADRAWKYAVSPSAVIRIKETLVSWRHLTVVTAQLPDKNLLRRFVVFVVNGAGIPVSLTAHFATAAAADHEHQKIVRRLATGERSFE